MPSGRESGQRLATSSPCVGGPRGLRSLCPAWRRSDERSCHLAECLLACLPAYLPDLTIMNGHGAHRRQGGSQLAAEPACSRRVRAPSKPWGDGCSRQVGEATTRRVTWAWGSPDLFGDVRVSLRDVRSTAPCPPPLRLINSVEQTSTRPSHGKVVASLSYEPLGVCFLVRRQTPVGHGVFMPCHERAAPARTSPTRV